MAQNTTKKKLNPEIKEIDIGTRELRTIKVYPLSANDQFQLANRLINSIDELSSVSDFKTNEEAIGFMENLITENLQVILEYAVDEEERPSFDEMTNNQIYEIANAVFEVNYEGFIKNFKNLFNRAAGLMGEAQMQQALQNQKQPLKR